MNLNLTNQQAICNGISLKTDQLKEILDLRSPMWNKIATQNRKEWLDWGKDPALNIVKDLLTYLVNNFPGLIEYHTGVKDDT